MSTAVTFLEEEVWATKTYSAVEGETITYACEFWDTATSPSCKVYKNGSSTDYASVVMPSGSHSASGTTVTLKPATAMVGGARYVFAVTATVESNTRVKKFMVICQKDEERQ